PQVFKKDLILRAYENFNCQDVTDDAMLVERLEHPVRIVKGSYFNIKITTPEDLVIAEAILSKCKGKGRGKGK
ncbi:MAG: 2-C-methyl-D-erythritol 4-phosphate cytidylyltransferase, partial [Candidatus Omnitrophica bacterium]|nr:2-C-methyl-D-erythritol 4-phosphate cytidylyltransferase [Candidatus Omnitrophota bacterium]